MFTNLSTKLHTSHAWSMVLCLKDVPSLHNYRYIKVAGLTELEQLQYYSSFNIGFLVGGVDVHIVSLFQISFACFLCPELNRGHLGE